MMDNKDIDIKDWKYFLSILEKCTDDYMYIYDLTNDHCIYSKSITDVFALENNEFDHAGIVLKGVIHPDDYESVLNEISNVQNGTVPCHNMEYRWKTKKNGYVYISCRGELVRENGINYLVGRVAEIGRHNKFDNVTGLCTEDVLQSKYAQLAATGSHYGYMMIIGIDNFKEINEKYGDKAGDDVLSTLAGAIIRNLSEPQAVFRLKGDQFAIISVDLAGDYMVNAKSLYKRIRLSIDEEIERTGYEVFYNISAGAAEFDTLKDTYADLVRNLKFTLHSAKLKGKNRFEFFTNAEYDRYIRRLDIQEELRKSINNHYDGFELFYQPIVDAKTQKITGSEALIRWNSKKYGFLEPDEFIHSLEESALIIPLGKWIIDTAAKACNKWIEVIPEFVMHINLSFVQIIKSDILKDTLENIRRYSALNNHYVFEITESIHMDANSSVQRVLFKFNENQFSLAIDDFGTGYSNFSYMKDELFNILKVDRSFISNIHNNHNNYLLVGFIIKMAHELNSRVCIEGVETQEELDTVLKLEPDFIQGYYFGRPVREHEFEQKYLHAEEVPESDEIEAIIDGRKDRAESGTIPHNAVNWD